MKIISPNVEILTPLDGQAVLQHIEQCGQCYKSEDKITESSAPAFVANIIKRGHEAVLEHFTITAKFICDRGVSHEIVRHRLASYCQESTRYCNYSKDGFGCSPQEARAVLPNSLKTEVVMTANFREWRHFFNLRTAPAAHPQMREVAKMLPRQMREMVPVVFDDCGEA